MTILLFFSFLFIIGKLVKQPMHFEPLTIPSTPFLQGELVSLELHLRLLGQLGQVYSLLIIGPLNWVQLSIWAQFICLLFKIDMFWSFLGFLSICCLVISIDQISIFMISSCYWLKWLVWFVAYISKTGDKLFRILSWTGHIIGWLFCC